jgi:vacuole morphology and inheritance protein 14
VKNGAELLDRLIKDIASESAATFVSILQMPEGATTDPDPDDTDASVEPPTAFSLARFIPLLEERIHVINPFTRTFLVSWITLLDSIPDLELVFYLPAFLAGLFKFLSDPNRDVHVATQGALERFLAEIRRIARIKRGIEESRRSHGEGKIKPATTSDSGSPNTEDDASPDVPSGDNDSGSDEDGQDASADGDWIPGQDVHVDHPKILEILVAYLDSTSGIV